MERPDGVIRRASVDDAQRIVRPHNAGRRGRRRAWEVWNGDGVRSGGGGVMPRAALLIVWPPCADPMAVDARRAVRGAVLWYVGAGRGVGGGGAADAGDAGRAR